MLINFSIFFLFYCYLTCLLIKYNYLCREQKNIIKMDKVFEIGNEIKIESNSTSIYGNINGVNIRISDHLPKTYNIRKHESSLVSENGELKFIFILAKDYHSDFNKFSDTDEIESDLIEELSIELDVDEDNLSVSVYILDTDEDFEKDYFEMLLRTI